MVAVFIYELVVNARAQGTPVSFKVRFASQNFGFLSKYVQPVVNPTLGPSSSALISVGARFPPCMKYVDTVPPSTPFACECSSCGNANSVLKCCLGLNDTANPATEICPLEEICGFGGKQLLLCNVVV